MLHRRLSARSEGQAIVEIGGVLVLAAILLLVLVASGFAQQVASGMACEVNHVFGQRSDSACTRMKVQAPPPGFFNCPAAGQSLPTQFPQVNVPVKIPGKPYSLSYGKLALGWSSVSPTGGAACSLQSTSGSLPLILHIPLLGSHTVGYSVTSARLDFMSGGSHPPVCNWSSVRHACSLNGDGPLMVRWTTPGFKEQVDGHTVYDTGPLTYYIHVNSGNVSSELQAAELEIHETLIAHLPEVMPLAFVQEPPADVWVRDADGRVTGRTSSGQVLHQIPNSEYFTDNRGYAAVLLLTPGTERFSAAAVGAAGGRYSLSISSLSPLGGGAQSVSSSMRAGRLSAHGSSGVVGFGS